MKIAEKLVDQTHPVQHDEFAAAVVEDCCKHREEHCLPKSVSLRCFSPLGSAFFPGADLTPEGKHKAHGGWGAGEPTPKHKTQGAGGWDAP